MLKHLNSGAYFVNGSFIPAADATAAGLPVPEAAKKGTMAYSILERHNTSGNMSSLKIRFDAMASHDITYVGIIQTARASGLKEFPLPYVLTNCHNSLCAVGGTINEDDHVFGLTAAQKYGGEFVPAHQAVIHSYMRERYAGGGKMLLGSDSHTRYGPFGTMAMGEGGPELVKQLLNKTYDISYPRVVAIYLTGKPRPGVGPQDIALDLVASTFHQGIVKNAVMEFFGPGLKHLAMDYRSGIDVMTTETSCLSSIWETDETVKQYMDTLGRGDEFQQLSPALGAYYDDVIVVDLDKAEPMIALPFHPSNAYTIADFKANMEEILHQVDQATVLQFKLKQPPVSLRNKIHNGKFYVDQAVVAGCSGGTYQNIKRMAEMLKGKTLPNDRLWLSIYPGSMPAFLELSKNGSITDLLAAGASVRSCFCGPCFGAGDVPANNAFSIRHSTRNFPNREGSKPADGQLSYVALMDARSIAATVLHGGALTSALELPDVPADPAYEPYTYDDSAYKSRIYCGVGHPKPETELILGPNITDWPKQIPMPEHLLMTAASAIYDSVTTTDELIPSGDTSSYRSNPLRLSEFTLSRKDPAYVGRAKAIQAAEQKRRAGNIDEEVRAALAGYDAASTGLGSFIMAIKPGDGSAREQAASCQRVLGGVANIASEYATKRYRSNVVNWGMLPFIAEDVAEWNIQPGDQIYLPGIRALLQGDAEVLEATLIQNGLRKTVTLKLPALTREERDIVLAGCLINYYAL